MNIFTNHITSDDDTDYLEEFTPIEGQPAKPSNKHIPVLPKGYRN